MTNYLTGYVYESERGEKNAGFWMQEFPHVIMWKRRKESFRHFFFEKPPIFRARKKKGENSVCGEKKRWLDYSRFKRGSLQFYLSSSAVSGYIA